ncbi:MAG TPA: HNH endonuclease signature motif containing protein [Acidimicrobiales bacterium]|nr:HNH endonuclease signature motif containing protein [Acidimicrobiales bacterium]
MSAGLLSGLKDLRVALVGFDAGVYSGADCAVLAEELAATEKACGAARLLAAARAIHAGAHKDRGFAEGADWLARHSGSTGSQARQALQTASRLGGSPDTREAMLDGQISLAQAAEITASSPDARLQLLATARNGDLSKVRDHARQHRMASVTAEELHSAQRKARYFRHWRNRMGMVCFAGELPPDTGLPFVRRVELAAYRARRDAHRYGRAEGRDAHAADALISFVSSPAGGGSGGRRAELVIVCDVNAYRRGHSHPGEPCHIIGGGPIPVDIARQLGSDAFLKAVIHDGVNVHTIAHFGRHIPAHLRTALELGAPPHFDGLACARCGRKWGLQLDHDRPVAARGLTELNNLQALCWQDHHDKTEEDRQAGLLGGSQPQSKPRPADTS